MSLRPLVAAFLLAGSVPAMAQSFDISLSDDSAKLLYAAPMGQQGFGRGELDASVLFTDNDAFMGALGFGVVGEAGSGSPGLNVGVGARLYGVNTDTSDVGALTLGARLSYSPPRLPRLSLGGAYNYAPSIVTFMDGKRFSDGSVTLGYEIFQDAMAYVGYRYIRADIDNGPDVTVDKGAHLGINLRF